MIADKMVNSHLYDGLGLRFQQAFHYLRETDLAELPPGRYEIDGDNLYVMIQEYETKSSCQAKIESHMEYADIQYLLEGTELMGYAPLEQLALIEDQRPAKDNKIYKDVSDQLSFIKLEPGMFVVFLTDDAHMPNVAACGEMRKNRKAVMKVKLAD